MPNSVNNTIKMGKVKERDVNFFGQCPGNTKMCRFAYIRMHRECLDSVQRGVCAECRTNWNASTKSNGGRTRNLPADAPESRMTERESFQPTTPFPDQTPPGMAYVPYQQWEEPYDADTAFPIGTMFPALDYPYRGGGSFA